MKIGVYIWCEDPTAPPLAIHWLGFQLAAALAVGFQLVDSVLDSYVIKKSISRYWCMLASIAIPCYFIAVALLWKPQYLNP